MKKLKHSKTIWFNLAVGLIAVLEWVKPGFLMTLGVPEDAVMPIMSAVGTVVAFINLWLRTKTNEGVELPKMGKRKFKR